MTFSCFLKGIVTFGLFLSNHWNSIPSSVSLSFSNAGMFFHTAKIMMQN